MSPRSRKSGTSRVDSADYRHSGEKRKNIPPAKIASEGTIPKVERMRYAYNPHLPPVLRFDATGGADRLSALVDAAKTRPLDDAERALLRGVLSVHEPWLEWAGKREDNEKSFFAVDPVALHIHERVSAQACIRSAMRKDVPKGLFADPEQSYREAVQFYRHDIDWANRLILGDSLQVMSSLAKRENLASKVQMIYMDPPYGIRFASNFQPLVGQRDVKDKDADLNREPEVVRAYRDTWQLGVHSYLEYLRQRLIAARDLLTNTGSMFLQINDENLHRVRAVLDEVMGADNFVSLISFQTTSGFAETGGLSRTGDYILWYARERETLSSNVVYEEQDTSPGAQSANWILLSDGSYRGVSTVEATGERSIPAGSLLYLPGDLQSQGAASTPQPYKFEGKTYLPGVNNHWKPNYPTGLDRLAGAGRIHVAANSIRYRRLATDFPLKARGNLWTDTQTGSFTEAKLFAVQTNPRVIERCLLLSTKPGDLVLDPTCGSGTTAVVAEQW